MKTSLINRLGAGALFATTALAAAHAALAQDAHKRIRFDIPAENTAAALNDFARQASVQILFPYDDAAKHQSAALSGAYTRAAALKALTARSGLAVASDQGDTVVLKSAAEASSSAPLSAGHDADPAKADTQPASAALSTSVNEVVVTARAGADSLTKAKASYAITVIPKERLRLRGVSSVTDALKDVPGFWVEASGGEASGNIRARGIPVDGFGSINLEEDGLPIQHDPALGYLNADQSFRLDESIDRVEVVRGGPSSIFTSNAPGGVVNFITRQPGDAPEGIFKYTAGSDGLNRVDAWYGQPIGDWKVSIGGFYRSETGVRDAGFQGNLGGQIRLSASRDFSRGSISFDYKHLDDRVAFLGDIPLMTNSKGDVVSIPGFNASTATIVGPQTTNLTLKNGTGGVVNFDDADGTRVRLDQYSAHLKYDLGGGWELQDGFRYRDSHTVRNGVYPSAVQTAASYISSESPTLLAAYPTATSVQLRYTYGGQAFNVADQNGNGLVTQSAVRPVTIAESEALDDLRVVHKFDVGGQVHDVAFGVYFAHIDETFSRYSATVLTDTKNNAGLLDLVALNASGQVVGSLTDDGVTRFGSEFADGTGSQWTQALYASDEWQITDQFRIDGGLRYEHDNIQGSEEGTSSVNLNDPTNLAGTNVLTGSGQWTNFTKEFGHLGWTIGGNYQFDSNFGVFARYTSTFRLPSISDYITNATATPVIQRIKMEEGGVKYASRLLSVYLTAFNTDYDSYAISNYIFQPLTGGFLQQTEYGNTNTYGLELEGLFQPVPWFDLGFNSTIENPTFSNLKYTNLVNNVPVPTDYDGNQLLRVPKVALRFTPGLNLLDDRLRAELNIEYYGDRFADAANTQKLPAYTVLSAAMRYQLAPRLTLYLNADNLTDTIGLTEGNPRAGELASTQAGQADFIGRPIVGRSVRGSILYKF